MSRYVDLDDYSHCFCGHDGEYEKWNIDPDAIVPTIEPKKGKWIPFDISWYECSECGAVRENNAFMEHYCPNCGADMREGEQDG